MITKILRTQLLTLLVLISFGMSAFAAAADADVVSLEDLYELDSVYFQKFTSEPFNGTATVYLYAVFSFCIKEMSFSFHCHSLSHLSHRLGSDLLRQL